MDLGVDMDLEKKYAWMKDLPPSSLVHDPEDDLEWVFDGHEQPRFQILSIFVAVIFALFAYWCYAKFIYGELLMVTCLDLPEGCFTDHRVCLMVAEIAVAPMGVGPQDAPVIS